MKRQNLSDYLDRIKSAIDGGKYRKDWNKAKRLCEIATKKLTLLSYSPFEEFKLYNQLGVACYLLEEYSNSLNAWFC